MRVQLLDGCRQFLERNRVKAAVVRCVRGVRLDTVDRLSQIDKAKAEPYIGGLLNRMNIHVQRCDGIEKMKLLPTHGGSLQGIELIQHQRRYRVPDIQQFRAVAQLAQLAHDFVYSLHGIVFLNAGCVAVNGKHSANLPECIDSRKES
jgi:hypothetical protein